jgi:hypothetical protein
VTDKEMQINSAAGIPINRETEIQTNRDKTRQRVRETGKETERQINFLSKSLKIQIPLKIEKKKNSFHKISNEPFH